MNRSPQVQSHTNIWGCTKLKSSFLLIFDISLFFEKKTLNVLNQCQILNWDGTGCGDPHSSNAWVKYYHVIKTEQGVPAWTSLEHTLWRILMSKTKLANFDMIKSWEQNISILARYFLLQFLKGQTLFSVTNVNKRNNFQSIYATFSPICQCLPVAVDIKSLSDQAPSSGG